MQLRSQMSQWLEEMKTLKEAELFYKDEATSQREAMEALSAQYEVAKESLRVEVVHNEELNKINTKLIGEALTPDSLCVEV